MGNGAPEAELTMVLGPPAATVAVVKRSVATRVGPDPAAARVTGTPPGALAAFVASLTATLREGCTVATVSWPPNVCNGTWPTIADEVMVRGEPAALDGSRRILVKRKMRVPWTPVGSNGTPRHVIEFGP